MSKMEELGNAEPAPLNDAENRGKARCRTPSRVPRIVSLTGHDINHEHVCSSPVSSSPVSSLSARSSGRTPGSDHRHLKFSSDSPLAKTLLSPSGPSTSKELEVAAGGQERPRYAASVLRATSYTCVFFCGIFIASAVQYLGVQRTQQSESRLVLRQNSSDDGNWYSAWKQSFFVSHSHSQEPVLALEPRFVMCLIHKNANTQFKELLLRLRGRSFEPQNVHMAYYRHPDIPQISELPDEEAIEVLTDFETPKYAVVRNPLVRILSAYRDKVERKTVVNDPMEEFSKFAQRWYEKKPAPWHSCDEWIHMDRHWVPQICFCGFHQKPQLFTIFKYEDIHSFMDELEDRLPRSVMSDGWGLAHNVSLRRSFEPAEKTEHATSTEDHFYEYYSLKTFDLMARKLQPEINLFGYQAEISRMRRQVLRRESGAREENAQVPPARVIRLDG